MVADLPVLFSGNLNWWIAISERDVKGGAEGALFLASSYGELDPPGGIAAAIWNEKKES
jgi:hypothetical protein